MRHAGVKSIAFGAIGFMIAGCATGPILDEAETQAFAEPVGQINVVVDPDIIEERPSATSVQRSSDFSYVGPRDAEDLAEELRESIAEALTERGVAMSESGGAVVSARITRAVPNNPSFTEVGQHMNLAPGSFARGGATIEAELLSSAGASLGTYRYSYFEPTGTVVRTGGVWTDAERAFRSFATGLADELADAQGS